MGCEAQRENLVAHLYGELSPEEAGAFEAHRSLCPDCRREFEELAKVSRAVQNWHTAEEPWAAHDTGPLAVARSRGTGWRERVTGWLNRPIGMPRWGMVGAMAAMLAVVVVATQVNVLVDQGQLVVRWGDGVPVPVGGGDTASYLAGSGPGGALGIEGDYLLQQVANMITDSEQRQMMNTERVVGFVGQRLNQERADDLRTVTYQMGMVSDQTSRELDRTNQRLEQMAQMLASSEAWRPTPQGDGTERTAPIDPEPQEWR